MASLNDDLQQLETAMSRFFQAMKRPQRWARVLQRANLQLDRPAAHILQTLNSDEHPACRVQDLATQLGIEAPSVTRKTQELEQLGYLRRRPDPRDRRAVDLTITPRGRAIARRLWAAQRESITQVLEDWPAKDRQRFVELFDRFSQDIANEYDKSITKTERTAHGRRR